MQTESAECENQLAKSTRMKYLLAEQTSAEVVEQDLLIQRTSTQVLVEAVSTSKFS